jgi:hypothetical protein
MLPARSPEKPDSRGATDHRPRLHVASGYVSLAIIAAVAALLELTDELHVGALVVVERHLGFVIEIAAVVAEVRLAALSPEAVPAHRIDAVTHGPELDAAKLLGVALVDGRSCTQPIVS